MKSIWFGAAAVFGVSIATGCALEEQLAEEGFVADGFVDESEEAPDSGEWSGELTTCTLTAAGVYSPFAASGTYPMGPVARLPWRGKRTGSATAVYPDGAEDFRGYATLPTTVECGSDKGRRSHLDVTAGCLQAVATSGGTYQRGRIQATTEGYFRALALGYAADDATHPVKWTDQAIEYRFSHAGKTGTAYDPGFKAFVRYRSEDDLYVASWRFDGVVQIQRKKCGQYTTLAMLRDFGPPTPNTFHKIRFEAIGDELALYLDGRHVLGASAGTFSWGTVGIRVDSANGSYIDDWRVE